MKTNATNLISIFKVFITTLLLLLLPLLFNQTNADFNWSLGDFLVGGLIIFSFGLYITWIWRLKKSNKRKALFILLGFILLAIIWTELAVGIFESPFSGN
ncbi:MAG: hypothetical protein CMB99_05370 [Flavobacteriaceae bacterium]|nr:hypothetical protein [Flavobacteriaceae bacterium]|tara:strand:+ start:28313 stop:28612 length:300 start_codon:yes stop_codon:yes gene_type:complete